MTMQQVKNDLPDVLLHIGKQIITAHVCGRLMPFATVWYIDQTTRARHDVVFCWESVTESVNQHRPLRIVAS